MTNTQIAAVAEIVEALATRTPRRSLTLVHEHGPFRGRPFFNAPVTVAELDDVDDSGRRLSRRAQIAWAAC